MGNIFTNKGFIVCEEVDIFPASTTIIGVKSHFVKCFFRKRKNKKSKKLSY